MTSYERDNETDLDFAQARYFNSGFGRFSSPDDFTNDSHASDPKSWNLYVYVKNNPLVFIDPTGKIQEENGKVVTQKRDGEDPNTTKIDKVEYFKFGIVTLKNGKNYLAVWKVDKVSVFADNDKERKNGIKAYQATGGIQLIEGKLNKDNQFTQTGNLIDTEKSVDMLEDSLPGTLKPVSNETNCHGMTLAKGQVWIADNSEVKKLMEGDGYDTDNPTLTPKVGDVGVFSTTGKLDEGMQHSVRVNSVNAAGNVENVISKNGIAKNATVSPNAAWTRPGAQLFYYSKKVKQ